jgi:pimeloyl-ACP methyl ester carboxylesterase
MPRALVNTGIELEYDTFGSPEHPTLLLVMGFTAQMTAWDDAFCQLLADGGLHVVRFDNRDCGLSSKMEGQEVDLGAVLTAALTGQPVPEVPYTLSHMSADAIGLLDHLGIDTAHIMGASMGGMIVQTMAIEHPTRVRSLISVMSMPGEPDVGQPAPEVAAVLLAPPATDRQGYIDDSPKWMVWQSKKYRDEAKVKENAAASYDRSFYPAGGPRQMAAIYASGARTEALQQLDVPTLVIHGRDDTLITPGGGLRTAELIPGAHLLFVADMGHDMPEPLWPLFIDAIHSHVRRAG